MASGRALGPRARLRGPRRQPPGRRPARLGGVSPLRVAAGEDLPRGRWHELEEVELSDLLSVVDDTEELARTTRELGNC